MSSSIDLTDIPNRLKPLLKIYETSLFSGNIGRLKEHTVKLHIKENVPPVAQRERRIPFALRKRVHTELAELEKQGIIEDITDKPTPWLSPMVIVPKGKNGIRLCLDMRNANKAIERTRYPTPTVEDLTVKLRKAKKFSKLDLKSAFHQLELSPKSRYITAFQTK